MRQISSSIIVSSTAQGEGLYNRNYTWEGGGGGGLLSGRYKAAMNGPLRSMSMLHADSSQDLWLFESSTPGC